MTGLCDSLWRDFEPRDQLDMLDITLRALRATTLNNARKRPLTTRSVTRYEANAFLAHVHRHHDRIQGWKFAVGLEDEIGMVGLVVVGRPVSRVLDDGRTLEITRCALMERVPNGASRLLGAACRIAKELGYGTIITYTLADESGESLRAVGFTDEGEAGGGQWDVPSRRRRRRDEEEDATVGPKRRWRKELANVRGS